MKTLNENWLTQGLIDPEYKKYILLAYLQGVKAHFDARRLYPFLSDLVFHYNNLMLLKENKELIYRNFPKEITKADFEKLQITYRQIIGDDQMMQALEDIINFSLPRFKSHLDEGAGIYEEIVDCITIEPIGITPLFTNEGYLLTCITHNKEVQIFRYKAVTFNQGEESYRAINIEHIETAEKNLANTYENIKFQLIKRYKSLPNPATFLAYSRVQCPFDETLLPIAKRLLIRHLEDAA